MTDLDPATPRPSGTRADAPPRTDVALRPVAADDADFLWTWIHGAEDPEWKSWDAPYFHAADTAAPPSRADFDADHARRRVGAPAGAGWWELGILLFDPTTWGRGVGRAALTLWSDASFAETDAHLLSLVTWSGNARMIASAVRVGYTEVARIPEARSWEGRRWDSVQLAVLRRDWWPASTDG